nr:MAG TPA: adenine-specific methyltransferase [Caudoviricetes sp.]
MNKKDTYEEWLRKFEIKKTTDDCYTPAEIYEAVKEWAIKEYDIKDEQEIVRPFYPGGDYQNYEYSENCVVLDNPPFSIFSQIVDWYLKNNIKFLLFAPSLTVSNITNRPIEVVYSHSSITYENGAKIGTAFVTNLRESGLYISNDLYKKLKEIEKKNKKSKTLKKIAYPKNLFTGIKLGTLAKKVNLKIKKDEFNIETHLINPEGTKYKVYGGVFLFSDKVFNKIIEKMNEEINEKEEKIKLELSEEQKDRLKQLNMRN